MTVLVTCDWLLDGRLAFSETVPVDLAVIEGLEKSIHLHGPDPDKDERLTVRLQFDPGLHVPRAPA